MVRPAPIPQQPELLDRLRAACRTRQAMHEYDLRRGRGGRRSRMP
ncbi:MAG TPA: hypothetical protein VM533_20470 [Fimbriiglobus sp.]|nr:hypothetical protein [Fimbriiglobus sp.]